MKLVFEKEKLYKLFIVLPLLLLVAVVSYGYFYALFEQKVLLVVAALVMLFIMAVVNYYKATETHYFILLDQQGKIKRILQKRLAKTARDETKAVIASKAYTIKTNSNYHYLTALADTELELKIDMSKATAEAVVKKEEEQLLSYTIKSLASLFGQESLLMLLIVANIALTAITLVMVMMGYGGGK